jgi:hypothetical protein
VHLIILVCLLSCQKRGTKEVKKEKEKGITKKEELLL